MSSCATFVLVFEWVNPVCYNHVPLVQSIQLLEPKGHNTTAISTKHTKSLFFPPLTAVIIRVNIS